MTIQLLEKKAKNILQYGHGHYGKDVKAGQTITLEEANTLLRNDIIEYENYVLKQCDYLNLTQNEFDALVIFTYNLGQDNLRILTKDKTRSKQEIAEHITAYTNSKSENNRKGLLNRRTKEKKLFLKGEY